MSVVSPFVGRVKDWWDARARLSLDAVGLISDADVDDGEKRKKPAIETHPGLKLLRDIRNAYTQLGTKTQIMAAGFRSVDELVEVGRYGSKGGPDLVTLPPELLDGLKRREGRGINSTAGSTPSTLPTTLAPTSTTISTYFDPAFPDPEGTLFENALKEEGGIALDKVPEGLEKFSKDAIKLEGRVRCALEVLREAAASGKSQVVGQTSPSDGENGQLERTTTTTTTLVAKKGLEGIEWVEQASSLNLNLCAVVQEGITAVGQRLGQSVKVI